MITALHHAIATERLEAKITIAEQNQADWKLINATIRKHKKSGVEAQVKALAEIESFKCPEAIAKLYATPDEYGRVGIPSYQLTNNNANIRRMKDRLIVIERNHGTEVTEREGSNATLEDNPQDNRVRLFFPGKPTAEVRSRLKSNGFRWTPSLECWQAYRNPRSLQLAEQEAGIG